MSSNEEAVYTNWCSGEPNNYYTPENCAIKSMDPDLYFGWLDFPCGENSLNANSRALHALCEVLSI